MGCDGILSILSVIAALSVFSVKTDGTNLLAIDNKPITVHCPVIDSVRVFTDTDLRGHTVSAVLAVVQIDHLAGDELDGIALTVRQVSHADDAVLLLDRVHNRLKRRQVLVHVLALLLQSRHSGLQVVDVGLQLRVVVLAATYKGRQHRENQQNTFSHCVLVFINHYWFLSWNRVINIVLRHFGRLSDRLFRGLNCPVGEPVEPSMRFTSTSSVTFSRSYSTTKYQSQTYKHDKSVERSVNLSWGSGITLSKSTTPHSYPEARRTRATIRYKHESRSFPCSLKFSGFQPKDKSFSLSSDMCATSL